VNYSLLDYLGLFLVTSAAVGLLTPRFRNLALQKKIFDAPNSQHKTHIEPVPYLGGLAIISGVILVALPATYITNPSLIGIVLGILLPPLFLGAIGLIDDLVNLSPWPRFIAQSIAGITVATTLILTDTVGSPTGSRTLDLCITTLFIVGLSNSINFFDNVDGGASGTVAISTFSLAFLSYSTSQYYIAALSIVLAGATSGFLWWNKSPARIYMGDAGSLFLGSLLASLLVRFEPKPITFPTAFFVPLFLIAVPLLDTCTVIISRIARGVSPFKGGRDHLSHRLMRQGLSRVRAVILLWTMTIVFGLFAITLSNISFKIEPIVTLAASTFWLFLLFIFLKMPAQDQSIQQPEK
jgi:UDP-GlcNAc:undecaprenyl-phosphate GlcNAc-1-phosphate transferase